jgi:dipeptidyl aminopeptidase/acylaminoacyl peptidase
VAAGASPLPTLLAVYPGQADTWEGVSIPLAAAGYAVIAVGPAYALDLDDDIAELQRLAAFARAGALPGVDARRMAVLGGSYSSLHVQALLERDAGFRAVLLLGGISDIFDMRRRFEQGSFIPPFGLDQALIALGTPNSSPERYWRYSSRYHLRRGLPPMLLMHSRNDEIVPFQQSEQLAADLVRLDVPHEAYFFDGLSHYLLADRPSAELTNLYDVTLAFLRRTL